jgi:beta-mannosidase
MNGFMQKIKPTDWKLRDTVTGERFKAAVPGDIHMDLFRAAKIPDPYFGLNHKEIGWVIRRDFEYSSVFEATEAALKAECVELVFDSIDLFSEVYVNGVLAGKTENMFLQYKFDVKPFLKKGKNGLTVKMLSTDRIMNGFDCSGYFGVYNVPRIFIRKTQCHFGWDWAPNLPGYGICGDVYIEYGPQHRIDDVQYLTYQDKSATFIVELNYNVRGRIDGYGQLIKETVMDASRDKIRVSLAKKPGACGDFYVAETGVTGVKNLLNVFVDNAELWWPNGYGDRPLYAYKVELFRDGKLLSEKSGKLAFRTVELKQEPKDKTTVGYALKINGVDVFVKGSNWVPIECFTGCAADEKYERLLKLAKDANYNLLRVWGGGNYERDLFYDLCDEYGLMVWQDFALACADIPEESKAWVDNMVKEAEYQVKRLRNHPSLVYWCGGNEKTGAFGHIIHYGDFFTNYVLQGLVKDLDPTRPFARQSPCSYTDVGNDKSSGETHGGSFETSLVKGIANLRKTLTEQTVCFLSECATMGPNSLETLNKMFPADKLWPVNEYWDDRLMDNAYAAIVMPFTERQLLFARDLYGDSESVREFTAKGMLVHAECMRAEIEYSRVHKPYTSGILNWMYSDIWPSGTWSVVDYYTEPKQAYYQMKKSYEPVLVTFAYNASGRHDLYVVNDTKERLDGVVEFGQRTFDGDVLWSEKRNCAAAANGIVTIENAKTETRADAYLYVKAVLNGKEYKSLYSPDLWRGAGFKSDYSVVTSAVKPGFLHVKIKAAEFAKSVFLSFSDNYKYVYSDNYFDLEKGEEKEIIITSAKDIDPSKLTVTDFAAMTARK